MVFLVNCKLGLISFNCQELGAKNTIYGLKVSNAPLLLPAAGQLRFRSCFVIPSYGRKGGLALLWQKDWQVLCMDHLEYHIDVRVEGFRVVLHFIDIYGHLEVSR